MELKSTPILTKTSLAITNENKESSVCLNCSVLAKVGRLTSKICLTNSTRFLYLVRNSFLLGLGLRILSTAESRKSRASKVLPMKWVFMEVILEYY